MCSTKTFTKRDSDGKEDVTKLSDWWNDISAQSFDMTPSIDKPKRQHNISYSPIDNIFISNRERIVQVSSNIISDLSDHFSQFCFLGSSSKLFDV